MTVFYITLNEMFGNIIMFGILIRIDCYRKFPDCKIGKAAEKFLFTNPEDGDFWNSFVFMLILPSLLLLIEQLLIAHLCLNLRFANQCQLNTLESQFSSSS